MLNISRTSCIKRTSGDVQKACARFTKMQIHAIIYRHGALWLRTALLFTSHAIRGYLPPPSSSLPPAPCKFVMHVFAQKALSLYS